MQTPARACLVLALASSCSLGCSSGDPQSQASAAPDESLRPVTTIAEALAPAAVTAATTIAAPTTAAVPATEPTTTAAAAPLPSATVAPATVTIAVPVETTDLTGPPPIEDLGEGEHVGIVAAVDNGTIEFDRVEPLDIDGNGTVDAYQNDNPRLRSVPLPDRVLLDGEVVDRDDAAVRLGGISVLVRLTIVGQRLAAVDQLSVPI